MARAARVTASGPADPLALHGSKIRATLSPCMGSAGRVGDTGSAHASSPDPYDCMHFPLALAPTEHPRVLTWWRPQKDRDSRGFGSIGRPVPSNSTTMYFCSDLPAFTCHTSKGHNFTPMIRTNKKTRACYYFLKCQASKTRSFSVSLSIDRSIDQKRGKKKERFLLP